MRPKRETERPATAPERIEERLGLASALPAGGPAERVLDLSERLVRAGEKDRRAISRELHDGISQDIVALNLKIANLDRDGLPPKVCEVLDSVGLKLEGVADRIHGLCYRLYPLVLDSLGIQAAIQAECAAFESDHGLEVELHEETMPESLPEEIKLCLYRVLQEALRDAGRRALASGARRMKVRVKLIGGAGAVALSVEDDGDPAEIEGLPGGGTIGTEARAGLAGGELTVETAVGRGTRMRLSLPLPPGGRP